MKQGETSGLCLLSPLGGGGGGCVSPPPLHLSCERSFSSDLTTENRVCDTAFCLSLNGGAGKHGGSRQVAMPGSTQSDTISNDHALKHGTPSVFSMCFSRLCMSVSIPLYITQLIAHWSPQGLFPELHKACPAFIRHKDIMISPALLRTYHIPYIQVGQCKGTPPLLGGMQRRVKSSGQSKVLEVSR